MDGVDRGVRRPSLKERLRFSVKGFGCWGPTWGLRPTTMSASPTDSDGEEDIAGPLIESNSTAQDPVDNGPACPVQSSHSQVNNLAAALTAERQLRAVLDSDVGGGAPVSAPGTPGRVSLMRLLEDPDEEILKIERDEGGCGWMCCVCMGRKKGAAFIPCGHTFCRVCSRELRLNRGTCPLCNRQILEILDIY